MKRLWILLAALCCMLALFSSACVQAEETVTEITLVDTPSSIILGEDLTVTIRLPGDSGMGTLRLGTFSKDFDVRGDTLFTLSISAEEMIAWGLEPGDYQIQIVWYGDQRLSGSFPLTVTGEIPVQPDFGDIPFSVEAGSTIQLSGKAGSATTLVLQSVIEGNDGTSETKDDYEVSVNEEGDWSCYVNVNKAGRLSFDLRGYNGNLLTGAASCQAFVTDVSSLAAPTFTVEPFGSDGSYQITAKLGTVLEEYNEVRWFIREEKESDGSKSDSSGYGSYSDGSYRTWISPSSQEETTTFTMVYCIDGVYSLPGSVSVDTEPELPMYSLSLEIPEEWPAGKDLSFTWTPKEGISGQHINVDVENRDTHTYFWNDNYQSDTEAYSFTIPGRFLEAGSYSVEAFAGADSYREDGVLYYFTVTENPNRPAAPEITLNDSPSSVTPIYHFNLGRSYDRYYAELYEQDEESGWALNREKISESWDDTSAYLLYGQLHAGQWKVEISVLDGDTWSLPGALSFTVAQAPKLAEAELAESIGNIGLNSRFSIKLQPVENAGLYNAVLQSELSGENVASAVYYVNESNPPEVITLTFNSWDETAEPGAYRIKVTARDIEYEYEDSVTEFTNLTVYQTEPPAAPTEVSLCSSDETPMTEEERAGIYASTTYFGFSVAYPQEIQAVAYSINIGEPDGYEWESGSYELDRPAATYSRLRIIILYETGDFSFRVRVLTNGLWSEWSEPVTFTVIPMPQLSNPTISADKTAYALGEDLTLTITDIDPEAASLSISTGSYYWTYYQLTEPMVVTVPGEYLTAGSNYISASVSAAMKQSGRASLEVTVSGETPAAPTVTFSATTGAYGETIYAEVNAPGATEVYVEPYEGCYPVTDGSAQVPIEIYAYAPRSIRVRFRALVNGVWSAWTNYSTITCPTRPTVTHQDWEILPEKIVPGQDLQITFLPVEGISTYQVNFYTSLHAFGVMAESLLLSGSYDGPGTVTIPAGLFSEAGTYWFHNCAGIPGKSDLFIETSPYYTVEDYGGGSSLTISAEKTELNYMEETEISLGGVQASRVVWEYSRYNTLGNGKFAWSGVETCKIPAGETISAFPISFPYPMGGQMKVRVMAQVNGQWTAWSNELIFQMNPRANDPLFNPIPQVTVGAAGQPVRVSWEPAAHAESYKVSWSGNGSSSSLETTDLYAEIPTTGLQPGTYTVSVISQARWHENIGSVHVATFTVEEHVPQAVLNVSTDKQSYDYGDRIEMTAAITNPDGTTEGLAEQYPDARITATLVDENGDAVDGFIVQSSNGLTMSAGFPLANDGMPAGQYRIRVETNVAGLTAETELFEYTAVRPDMSVLSECSVELTLNTDVFSLDEPFKMTASVTDKAGNPVKGVKVGFMILDSEGNLFSDFFSYDWIWNVTRPDGQCSLTVTMRTGEGQVLRPASYQVKLFIVDMEEICDIKPFEFRLESLYLPSSLTAIESEAFAGTDSQAVFVPEGCTSIGERAFADCSQLYYIHIPAGVTDIADNAFEGCPDCLWIDRE